MPIKNPITLGRLTAAQTAALQKPGEQFSFISIGTLGFAFKTPKRFRNAAAPTGSPLARAGVRLPRKSEQLKGKRVGFRGSPYRWWVTRDTGDSVDLVVDLPVDDPEFLDNVNRNRLIDLETGVPLG